MDKKQPTAYILVGVPGSGKSTWYRNCTDLQGCVYVSSDYIIEQEALRQGRSYDEVHPEFINTAVQQMLEQVRAAVDAGQDIVWDQTNPTAKARRHKLKMLPGYRKVAVVFPTPDAAEHARRLQRPGKTVPKMILDSMIENFTVPTLEEGFDQILMVVDDV